MSLPYNHDISRSTAATSKDSSDYGIYTRVICQGTGTGNYNVGTGALYGGQAYAGCYKLDNFYGASTNIQTTTTGTNNIAGSYTLDVVSTAGMQPGMSPFIGNGGSSPYDISTWEQHVIDKINSTTQILLKTPLTSVQAAGHFVAIVNVTIQGNANTPGTADYFINQIFDTSAKSPQCSGTDPFNYGRIYDSSPTSTGIFTSNSYSRSWTFADQDIFWVDLGRNQATGNYWLVDYLQVTSFNPYKDNSSTPTVPQSIYIYYMTEEDFVAQTGYYPPSAPTTGNPAVVDPTLYNFMQSPTIRDSVSWQLLTDSVQCQDGQTNIDVSQFLIQCPTKLRFLKIRCTQPWYQFPTSGILGGYAAFVMSSFNVWLSRSIVRSAEFGYSPGFNSTTDLNTRARLMRRTVVLDQNLAISDGTTASQFALNDLRELVTDFVPMNVAVELSPMQLYDTVNYIDAETNNQQTYFVSEVTLNRNGPHSATVINYESTLN